MTRSGDLHEIKECSAYTGLADEFCTITSSNLEEIEVCSRVVYAQAEGASHRALVAASLAAGARFASTRLSCQSLDSGDPLIAALDRHSIGC